jgi:hypothetical protein
VEELDALDAPLEPPLLLELDALPLLLELEPEDEVLPLLPDDELVPPLVLPEDPVDDVGILPPTDTTSPKATFTVTLL